jgi:hypothetical protein
MFKVVGFILRLRQRLGPFPKPGLFEEIDSLRHFSKVEKF